MADDFTTSGFFNEPSGLSLLQDPDFIRQFSLFGESPQSLLLDPSFMNSIGVGQGTFGTTGEDLFFDTRTGQIVTRAQAEQLSQAHPGGLTTQDAANLNTLTPTTPLAPGAAGIESPGLSSQLSNLLKNNPILGALLIAMGGLGLAGVGQQLAGGGKRATQKTKTEQPPVTALGSQLENLVSQTLFSGGGAATSPGTLGQPSPAASSVLEALTAPRFQGSSPGAAYRSSLLKLLGA